MDKHDGEFSCSTPYRCNSNGSDEYCYSQFGSVGKRRKYQDDLIS